jgi:hypothetical protein
MKFNWKVILHMRRSPSRFLIQQRGLLAPRRSDFARFSGIIIQRRKQPGRERMIFVKTTHTYLLATPNLEGEIHLKGVRFVTS